MSRQTGMYCFYRTAISIKVFVQSLLNICEIIESLTHFTFCESKKTTILCVAFYSGKMSADS